MGDFFHGWRRKTGCVTLTMACMLVSLWMRSLHTLDLVSFPTGQYDTQTFASVDSSIGWERSHDEDPRNIRKLDWSSYSFDRDQKKTSDWRWAGFGYGVTPLRVYWLVSYWSITIPMTLLSLSLLLSKPVKKIVKVDRRSQDPSDTNG